MTFYDLLTQSLCFVLSNWCEVTDASIEYGCKCCAIYTVLALCVLSVGFMIRVLIALAIDGKKYVSGTRSAFLRKQYATRRELWPAKSPEAAKVPLIPQLTLRWELLESPLLSLRNHQRKTGEQRLAGSISPRYAGGGGNLIRQSAIVIGRVEAAYD